MRFNDLDALLRRIDGLVDVRAADAACVDELDEVTGPGRDAAGGVSALDERLPVHIPLTMGAGEDCKALIMPPSQERLWFPAAQVAGQLGVDVSRLPGMDVIAVVEGGELVRFEAA